MLKLRHLFTFTLILSASAAPHVAQAGFMDFFNELKDKTEKPTDSSGSVSNLSQQHITDGLKQALNQGVDKAVKQLGQENGFLNDAAVKIPMPSSLKKVEKGMRKVGADKYADEFINTMNHAAEQAVPKTTDILISSIKQMTLNDALSILKGEPDAATQYFKRTSAGQLNDAIKPIVSKATDSVGLTEAYKKMIKKAGFMAKFVDQDSLNLDQYITNRAIDGLFIKIASEEQRIRKDPVARTTDILKDVFGR